HEKAAAGDPDHGSRVRFIRRNARLHIAATQRTSVFCESFDGRVIDILRTRLVYGHEPNLARRASARNRPAIRSGSALLFFCFPQTPKQLGAHAASPTSARSAG